MGSLSRGPIAGVCRVSRVLGPVDCPCTVVVVASAAAIGLAVDEIH